MPDQTNNINANDAYTFIDSEQISFGNHTVHLKLYECYSLFTREAWKELKQQAEAAGINASDFDNNTLVAMTPERHKKSLHTSMKTAPLTRQVDEAVRGYATSQNISADKALSLFLTLGIQQVANQQLGFASAVRECNLEFSDLDGLIAKLSEIAKDNPYEDNAHERDAQQNAAQ